MNTIRQLDLIAPDDWHIHLRDDAALATTVPHAARQFARAIVMPNPQTTCNQRRTSARLRRAHHGACACWDEFHPADETLYLTDRTSAQGHSNRA